MGEHALSTINDQDAWGWGMERGNRMTWQATEHDILALCPLPHPLAPHISSYPWRKIALISEKEKNIALTDVADDKTPTPNSGIAMFSFRRKS